MTRSGWGFRWGTCWRACTAPTASLRCCSSVKRTGRGQVVRTSLLAAIVGVHAFQGTRWTVAGDLPHGQGNHHPSICPYGLFACADGAVQIAVGSDAQWRRLCADFDLDPDAAGIATNAERVASRGAVIELLESAFAQTKPDALISRLAKIGVPAGRVRTLDEVYAWDQTLSQGLLVDVEHATLGPIQLPGPPLRFFAPSAEGEQETTVSRHRPPPLLDEHGEQVREWAQAQ